MSSVRGKISKNTSYNSLNIKDNAQQSYISSHSEKKGRNESNDYSDQSQDYSFKSTGNYSSHIQQYSNDYNSNSHDAKQQKTKKSDYSSPYVSIPVFRFNGNKVSSPQQFQKKTTEQYDDSNDDSADSNVPVASPAPFFISEVDTPSKINIQNIYPKKKSPEPIRTSALNRNPSVESLTPIINDPDNFINGVGILKPLLMEHRQNEVT